MGEQSLPSIDLGLRERLTRHLSFFFTRNFPRQHLLNLPHRFEHGIEAVVWQRT